jgi:glycosyltransferase involved in cell wall biosynthesis
MPGLVGLAVLDAFNTNTPMITTDFEYHSPEIEYLQNGTNGIITENNLEAYVKAVVNTLQNANILSELKKGCLVSAELYTMEKMVENFAEGIKSSLGINTASANIRGVLAEN